MDDPKQLPEARFGDASQEVDDLEWEEYDEEDPDDEELEQTPADVVEMLGFDPLDED